MTIEITTKLKLFNQILRSTDLQINISVLSGLSAPLKDRLTFLQACLKQ